VLYPHFATSSLPTNQRNIMIRLTINALFILLIPLLLGRNNYQHVMVVVDAFVPSQPFKSRGSKCGNTCNLSPYDRVKSVNELKWGLALQAAAKSSGMYWSNFHNEIELLNKWILH
jgi:hypothetical protein